MENKKSGFILTPILFILVSLIFGGVISYSAIKNSQKSKTEAPSVLVQTQLPISTPAPTPPNPVTVLTPTTPPASTLVIPPPLSNLTPPPPPSNSIKIPAPQPTTVSSYAVTSIVDGDTIKVNINGTIETIRIIGINTPEIVDPRKPVECFGKESSDKAKELLSGKIVTLEADSSQGERDKYNRLLRYVFFSDGQDYGKLMINEGYAHEDTYNLPYKYQQAYKQAQATAQSNQAGLWSPDTCNGLTEIITTPPVPTSTQISTPTPTPDSTVTAGIYYTSSYHTSKYYYPESCNGWKGLSSKYLRSFSSLDELLQAFPNRMLNPHC